MMAAWNWPSLTEYCPMEPGWPVMLALTSYESVSGYRQIRGDGGGFFAREFCIVRFPLLDTTCSVF